MFSLQERSLSHPRGRPAHLDRYLPGPAHLLPLEPPYTIKIDEMETYLAEVEEAAAMLRQLTQRIGVTDVVVERAPVGATEQFSSTNMMPPSFVDMSNVNSGHFDVVSSRVSGTPRMRIPTAGSPISARSGSCRGKSTVVPHYLSCTETSMSEADETEVDTGSSASDPTSDADSVDDREHVQEEDDSDERESDDDFGVRRRHPKNRRTGGHRAAKEDPQRSRCRPPGTAQRRTQAKGEPLQVLLRAYAANPTPSDADIELYCQRYNASVDRTVPDSNPKKHLELRNSLQIRRWFENRRFRQSRKQAGGAAGRAQQAQTKQRQARAAVVAARRT